MFVQADEKASQGCETFQGKLIIRSTKERPLRRPFSLECVACTRRPAFSSKSSRVVAPSTGAPPRAVSLVGKASVKHAALDSGDIMRFCENELYRRSYSNLPDAGKDNLPPAPLFLAQDFPAPKIPRGR